jgi:hypothetical protein
MKTFLFDYTNFGVVYINEDTTNAKRWLLSVLRSCILDTNISTLYPRSPLYKDFTNASLSDTFYRLDRNFLVVVGEFHEVNEYLLEKQKRARLMVPLIQILINALANRSYKSLNDYGIPMDDTIAIELLESDPDNDYYSPGVIEYATTLEITPSQAYQELQLDYKTVHAVKMRAYATIKKYTTLIREVRTEEQAKVLENIILDKLYNDTFI